MLLVFFLWNLCRSAAFVMFWEVANTVEEIGMSESHYIKRCHLWCVTLWLSLLLSDIMTWWLCDVLAWHQPDARHTSRWRDASRRADWRHRSPWQPASRWWRHHSRRWRHHQRFVNSNADRATYVVPNNNICKHIHLAFLFSFQNLLLSKLLYF